MGIFDSGKVHGAKQDFWGKGRMMRRGWLVSCAPPRRVVPRKAGRMHGRSEPTTDKIISTRAPVHSVVIRDASWRLGVLVLMLDLHNAQCLSPNAGLLIEFGDELRGRKASTRHYPLNTVMAPCGSFSLAALGRRQRRLKPRLDANGLTKAYLANSAKA